MVPPTHARATEIDKKNGVNRGQGSEKTEMLKQAEYKTFMDKGVGEEVPTGYKKLQYHMLYDFKHD
jgi:hypothetical protein